MSLPAIYATTGYMTAPTCPAITRLLHFVNPEESILWADYSLQKYPGFVLFENHPKNRKDNKEN